MSKFDITDCTTDEIVDELGRRHTGCVLVAMNESVIGGELVQGVVTWFRGGWVLGVGLCDFGREDILRTKFNNREDADDAQ